MSYMYILQCSDGSYYTGSTRNLEKRLSEHDQGQGANYTKKRLPVELVYFEEYDRIDHAFYREKQVQGWSRVKKQALINGTYELLPQLAKKIWRKNMKNDTGELRENIKRLKESRNAVILAHNYQVGEVQDIADFVGDSLELSRQAQTTDAEVIVFCGVRFMAETAAILCPDKTVLMPDVQAGCPMANMISAEQVRELRQQYPKAVVVTYVNSNAEVKAESDICCTSANAVRIVNSLPEDEIIFLPDQHLGEWVQGQTTKTMHIWKGFCPTHQVFVPEKIKELKQQNPRAVFLAHPECSSAVLEIADVVASTSGMSTYAREHDGPFIVGTEVGMLHKLQKDYPGKRFIAASEAAVCPNMKKTTLEKVLWSLQDMQTVISVSAEVRARALSSIERMLAVR